MDSVRMNWRCCLGKNEWRKTYRYYQRYTGAFTKVTRPQYVDLRGRPTAGEEG